jgi:hypothetical protein
MRRGPLGALVLGLALLMQLLAPVLAAHAMAGSGGHVAPCVDAGSSDDADGHGSGSVPPHHEHCGLCQVVCGTAGLLDFLSVWISLAQPAESRIASWVLEPERKARFGLDQHRVPRGPPFLA